MTIDAHLALLADLQTRLQDLHAARGEARHA
jgi:hypothetical protein